MVVPGAYLGKRLARPLTCFSSDHTLSSAFKELPETVKLRMSGVRRSLATWLRAILEKTWMLPER